MLFLSAVLLGVGIAGVKTSDELFPYSAGGGIVAGVFVSLLF